MQIHITYKKAICCLLSAVQHTIKTQTRRVLLYATMVSVCEFLFIIAYIYYVK